MEKVIINIASIGKQHICSVITTKDDETKSVRLKLSDEQVQEIMNIINSN